MDRSDSGTPARVESPPETEVDFKREYTLKRLSRSLNDTATKDATFVLKLPSGLKERNNKRYLIESHANHLTIADSYTTNTAQEERTLEIVEDFRRQLVQLFPDRRPLLLFPSNECGLSKFICTTISPTQLPYPELYDLEPCATFVSDYLEYYRLDNPLKLPQIIPSSKTVLEVRAGDSFDFSILLVSLLRGSGYYAYCVSGYAPKWITMVDQKTTPCPTRIMHPDRVEDKNLDDDIDSDDHKYPIKSKKLHISYCEDMKTDKNVEMAKRLLAKNKREVKTKQVKHVDKYEKHRIHCWVLVKSGRRGIKKDIFVEATTGITYDIHRSPYIGIESVWNESNMWVNMQGPKHMTGLSYDLRDKKSWENVLIEKEASSSRLKEFKRARVGGGIGGGISSGRSKSGKNTDRASSSRSLDTLDVPKSWALPPVIGKEKYRNRYPKFCKTIEYSNCLVEKYEEYQDKVAGLVQRVSIYAKNDDDADIQDGISLFTGEGGEKGGGRKTSAVTAGTGSNGSNDASVQGACSIVDLSGNDSYPDNVVDVVVEYFRHRADRMCKRVTFKKTKKIVEKFEKGCKNLQGLMELIKTPERKIYSFHPNLRKDGMVSRTWKKGRVTETFQERDDRLIYRSFVMRFLKPNNERKNQYVVYLMDGKKEAHLVKIVEKFARNRRVSAHEDIEERTHWIEPNLRMVQLDYHLGDTSISRKCLVYNMTMGNQKLEVNSSMHKCPKNQLPTKNDQLKQLAYLAAKEKEIFSDIREREKKAEELDTALAGHSSATALPKNIYDAAQDHVDDIGDDHENLEGDEIISKNTIDYLAPFLVGFPNQRPRNKSQAQAAKKECLQALQERLLERATIIQDHLDREQEALKVRNTQYNRMQCEDPEEKKAADEEFKKFSEEIMFRLSILDARLKRHEKLAISEYSRLEKELQQDERLAIMHERR